MKVAVPVKTKRDNPAVAPLFGKAKYFAIVTNNNITIEKNPFQNGTDVVLWLNSLGVESLLIQEIGYKPYQLIQELGMRLYYVGEKRIELNEVIQKLNSGELQALNEEEIEKIIKHHEKKHSH